ncbi:hypothetical protein F4679DRAFT_566587 [Xylaria curta]|nr:hypothetical protein F4679DRAFT_566587 [Xylaria curta]
MVFSSQSHSSITSESTQDMLENETATYPEKANGRHRFKYEHCHIPFQRRHVFISWKWEIIAMFLAMGLLGSIYGILKRYDGQRLPDWGSAININSLIAVLSTILRALLGFVLAEIIGQAKWTYFIHNTSCDGYDAPARRLIAIDRFDRATKSVMSALRLFYYIIPDVPTSIAVTTMISCLGIGSFMQQSIQTQVCQFPVSNANASLPVSRNITLSTFSEDSNYSSPFDLSSVQNALYSALGPKIDGIYSVDCLTGNCTFPISGLYHTMGLCSACAETTSLITSTNWTLWTTNPAYPNKREPQPSTNYSLPNGMILMTINTENSTKITHFIAGSSSTEEGLEWAGNLISPDMQLLSKWAFANVTILTSDMHYRSNGLTSCIAATCTIYPCLRSYTSSVTNGKLRETLNGTMPAGLNVATAYPDGITDADIQDFNWDALIDHLRDEVETLRYDAVLQNCDWNDTVWDHTDGSSIDEEHLLILQPDINGSLPFLVKNTTAPRACIYGMDFLAKVQLESFISRQIFNGSYTINNVPPGVVALEAADGEWLTSFYKNNGTTAAEIIDQVTAFTDNFSNKLRTGLISSPDLIRGQALATNVCTSIHYNWLFFPAILVALTGGLLCWTLVQNYKHRSNELSWKSSTLPLLFYSERFVVENVEEITLLHNGHEKALSLAEMESEVWWTKCRDRSLSIFLVSVFLF